MFRMMTDHPSMILGNCQQWTARLLWILPSTTFLSSNVQVNSGFSFSVANGILQSLITNVRPSSSISRLLNFPACFIAFEYFKMTLGGNITDEGRSISLQCIGNKQFETREVWPECRIPEVCGVNDTLPEQSQESKDSGFNCNWQDTEEFITIDCNCTDPTKVRM